MRHALTLLIAVCCFGVFSRSQTADELIAKNIQARGGIEKMKAIKTLPRDRQVRRRRTASPRPSARKTSDPTWFGRHSYCRG